MAAPPVPAVAAPAVPAVVAPYVQGYLSLIDVLLAIVAVLAVALAWSLWRLASRRRSGHAWQVAYWHLVATATCPLCGSRMEGAPPQLPAGAVQVAHIPAQWDLR